MSDGAQPKYVTVFGETDEFNPFVSVEQMMPFLPFVRCRCVKEAIAKAKQKLIQTIPIDEAQLHQLAKERAMQIKGYLALNHHGNIITSPSNLYSTPIYIFKYFSSSIMEIKSLLANAMPPSRLCCMLPPR